MSKSKKLLVSLFPLFLIFPRAYGFADAVVMNPAPESVSITNPDLSPWMVRLRALNVAPDVSSTKISGIGGYVSHISSPVIPELDISYFFTKNIAAELILGTSRHSVEATNTALGAVDLGKVSLLPPTLTLQYHLFMDGTIRPYIGAGINYTYFYHVNSGPVADRIHYKNSFGPALQLGVDIALDDHWMINFDVKKIYIKSHVDVNALGLALNTRVKINPWVWGAGVGYRF